MAYDHDNIFARILRGEAPACRVYEDSHTLAILDVMPQTDGHTLILPKTAAENLFDLDAAHAAAVMATAQTLAAALKRAFAPDGLTVMQFNGAAAGQTVFHFHLHLLPRWTERPLNSHRRTMADSALLEQHAERIRTALAQLSAAGS